MSYTLKGPDNRDPFECPVCGGTGTAAALPPRSTGSAWDAVSSIVGSAAVSQIARRLGTSFLTLGMLRTSGAWILLTESSRVQHSFDPTSLR